MGSYLEDSARCLNKDRTIGLLGKKDRRPPRMAVRNDGKSRRPKSPGLERLAVYLIWSWTGKMFSANKLRFTYTRLPTEDTIVGCEQEHYTDWQEGNSDFYNWLKAFILAAGG